MKHALKTALVMVLAAAVGFGAVYAMFRGTRPLSASKAVVTFEVEARDLRGRALKNARVTFLGPKGVTLGRTDSKGFLRGRIHLPPGRAYAIELSGRNFRVRKELVVPARASRSTARLVFSLAKEPSLNVHRSSSLKDSRVKADPSRSAGQAGSRPNRVPSGKPVGTVSIQVFHGSQGDRGRIEAIAARLREAAGRNAAFLSTAGVASIQLRHLWNEASYVEIVPVTKGGIALGGFLLRSHKTDAAWLDFALKNMWAREFRTGATDARTLTVFSSRPHEARAYLNGIPLPRRIDQGHSVFDLTDHPAARAKGAILTLTSDQGPLIRSAVSVASLTRDIRWSIPETTLSRR